MSSRHYPSAPLLGVCTAIWRDNRILLAKRTAGPSVDTWAMPGGLVDVGEPLERAAIREVMEETALALHQLVFNRIFEIISHDDNGAVERHYVLAMYVARSRQGTAVAGDDAGDVRWFTTEELDHFPLTGRTKEYALESRALLKHLD